MLNILTIRTGKATKFLLISLALLLLGILTAGTIVHRSKLESKKTEQSQINQVKGESIEQAPATTPENYQQELNKNRQSVKVTRVIDGDTVEIEGGQKVRYIGIDTPETVHPDMKVQCFGKEASNKNKELVEGKMVELEKDVSETDKYGRLLRYVYIGQIFVNDYLVRQGYAHASSYPPDIKYQGQLQEAEKEARDNNRGLWGECNLSSQSSLLSQSSQPSGCSIKGNISSSSDKIYHMQGQKYYDKTVIDESRGERWFCSEEEAILEGWRKSKL